LEAYRKLDVFPKVLEVLRRLKQKGVKTAVLSNGRPEMLQAAINNAGITGLLDEILSVKEVGVYKPHPKVYQLAVDRLGVRAQDISECLPGHPDAQVTSLADLPFLRRP
jgi:2-haloacid dehalogenase